jgi:hypothetical protein
MSAPRPRRTFINSSTPIKIKSTSHSLLKFQGERDYILKIDDVSCENYISFKYLRKQTILRNENKAPTLPPISLQMSSQDISLYVEHLSEFKVIICNFCEECIPPNDPVRHYELHHTAKSVYPVSMEVHRNVRDYMATLDLCDPDKVVPPNRLVPQLKVIKKGLVCIFSGCGACRTTPHSMRTHYYTHQKSISKEFKDWEETSLQTFFEGQHRK